MVKELTASVHVFRRDSAGGWLTALVWNPRLGCWLQAGGHVEADETPAEAAVREVLEETGLRARLLPGPAVPLPTGFPHQPVTAPWWVSEMPASADRHTATRHVHVDHVFLAIAEDHPPAGDAAHEVGWFTEADVTTAEGISKDSRLQVLALFGYLPGRSPLPAPPADGAADGTGSEGTRLVVLRGNSASGKSSVAAEVRRRYGRGISIVGQDNLRRVVLREHDRPNAANIGLIGLTARYALDHGFHVIVEGILYASHYAAMLAALIAAHRGMTRCYYLDVPFEQTLARHATKAEALKYGEAEMLAWYRELDLLPGGIEQVIPAESSLDDTVRRVMADACLNSST